jgi:uncharacterized phage-associated protein
VFRATKLEFEGEEKEKHDRILWIEVVFMAAQFNQEKATATAAFFLKLRGSRMSYLKLIKLLYLADREALYRWGFSITTDSYVSMDHGPVVSNIYNLITIDERMKPFWSTYISPPLGEYEVELKTTEIPENQLSRAEEKLLLEIFGTYGTWNRWHLRDFTHTLPEWRDPHGSSVPIEISDILRAQGSTADEIKELTADMRAVEAVDRLIGSRT